MLDAGQIGARSVPGFMGECGRVGGEIGSRCHKSQEKRKEPLRRFQSSPAQHQLISIDPAKQLVLTSLNTSPKERRHDDQVSRSFRLGRRRPCCRVQGCVVAPRASDAAQLTPSSGSHYRWSIERHRPNFCDRAAPSDASCSICHDRAPAAVDPKLRC